MGGNCDSNGACAEVNEQMRGDNACAVSWLVTGQMEEDDNNLLHSTLFKVRLLIHVRKKLLQTATFIGDKQTKKCCVTLLVVSFGTSSVLIISKNSCVYTSLIFY